MFGIGVTELLVILAIVVLLFGTKKLKTLGADLGGAIRGFRSSLGGDEAREAKADDKVIDGEVASKQKDGV